MPFLFFVIGQVSVEYTCFFAENYFVIYQFIFEQLKCPKFQIKNWHQLENGSGKVFKILKNTTVFCQHSQKPVTAEKNFKLINMQNHFCMKNV